VATKRFLVSLSAAVAAMLPSANSSGLLVGDAAVRLSRRNDVVSDELVLTNSDQNEPIFADHESHSSHSSHQSHSSGSGGGWSGDSSYVPSEPAPAPAPPKPATVSFVAYPGGRIFVDGSPMGRDATGVLTLKAGSHDIRVVNRFLGEYKVSVELAEAQTGVLTIEW
jgi:hypothetical protein